MDGYDLQLEKSASIISPVTVVKMCVLTLLLLFDSPIGWGQKSPTVPNSSLVIGRAITSVVLIASGMDFL